MADGAAGVGAVGRLGDIWLEDGDRGAEKLRDPRLPPDPARAEASATHMTVENTSTSIEMIAMDRFIQWPPEPGVVASVVAWLARV
jgi:hypothetical protein